MIAQGPLVLLFLLLAGETVSENLFSSCSATL